MSGPGPARPPREVVDLEIVEDRTQRSRSDEGFLRVRRLQLRNVYADGGRSEAYPCDIVSRIRTDAVAVVIYEIGSGGAAGAGPAAGAATAGRRTVRVALKTGFRAPVFFRRRLALTQPDARLYGVIAEIVAGMLEPEDVGPDGIDRRAGHECLEESGIEATPDRMEALGAESFPSPGITDEKVHFRALEARIDARGAPRGDGSAMEEGGGVVVMTVEEAIVACRRGEIPDMKTELALVRLCDRIGYLPGLGCFVDELPAGLASRWRPLGIDRGP